MTYNLYVGADLAPLFAAQSVPAFDMALDQVMAQMEATDFRIRAGLIAQEISAVRPDLIALQEAAIWQTSTANADVPATSTKHDYLQLLLNALRTMGHEYWPVALGRGPDIEGPTSRYASLRFTNRNVILVRSDFCSHHSDIGLSNNAQFSTNVEVPSVVLGTIPLTRGWVSIDVHIRGAAFRLVSVHLEDSHPEVRQAQAAELMRRLAVVRLPIILVGDFNADADWERSRTYRTLLEAGFVDAWQDTGPLDGATCCQAPDLRNEHSTLSKRIDLILARGKVSVTNVQVIGNDRSRRTAGLWPSDHAGVVATVQSVG
jgi:endonuclease/exonuclease/phosphatase family metal-dependent hydrolase